MNKPRLEKLLVALEGVKPKDFDMTSYVHGCGSPACVLGYFASRTDLQRKFRLVKDQWRTWSLRLRETNEITDYAAPELLKYFGINQDQSDFLFADSYKNRNATPAVMRRRIRKFIDKNGAV